MSSFLVSGEDEGEGRGGREGAPLKGWDSITTLCFLAVS